MSGYDGNQDNRRSHGNQGNNGNLRLGCVRLG
jgi:hypothetical protein